MIKVKITCLPCSKNIEIKAKTLSIKFICVVKKSAAQSPKKSRLQKGYVIPGCHLARWDKSNITTPPPFYALNFCVNPNQCGGGHNGPPYPIFTYHAKVVPLKIFSVSLLFLTNSYGHFKPLLKFLR